MDTGFSRHRGLNFTPSPCSAQLPSSTLCTRLELVCSPAKAYGALLCGWDRRMDKPRRAGGHSFAHCGTTDANTLLRFPNVAVAREWRPYCLHRGCYGSCGARSGSSPSLPTSMLGRCTLRPAAQGTAPEHNLPQPTGYEIPSFPRLAKGQWLPPAALSARGDKGSFLSLEALAFISHMSLWTILALNSF